MMQQFNFTVHKWNLIRHTIVDDYTDRNDQGIKSCNLNISVISRNLPGKIRLTVRIVWNCSDNCQKWKTWKWKI